jgi:G3E family GTPase
MVAVTVVTGFLGAGKTTLVNRWLASYERGDVAVIVNEVGGVGIDGELLAERARSIIEITGGCICCVTHGELVRALQTLSGKARRIVVETSGAASPAGVIRAMHNNDVWLDGIVAVVDPTQPPDNDLAREQIGYADVIVLSRGDVATADTMERARTAVGRLNGTAVITEAAPLEELLAGRTGELPPAPEPSDHAIESISFTGSELDEDRFAEFMEGDVGKFAGCLLRMKGIVAIGGVEQRVIIQGVADRVEVTLGAPWTTERSSRLVLVGFGLEKQELVDAFAACAYRPDRA